MFGFSGFFRDLDRFRLLIQRCKRVGGNGNFFDQGRVLPDEGTRALGEGYDRVAKAEELEPGIRRTGARGWAKNEAATGVLFPWRQFFCQGQRSIFRLIEGSWMGWNHLDGFHFSQGFFAPGIF